MQHTDYTAPIKAYERPIKTTQDAIKASERLLLEAEAHWMLRQYRPDDEHLGSELHKCLALARVFIAVGLEVEARGGE